MPDTLKMTLAQLNQSVGDIAGNAESVLAARRRARGSDLVVFPELHLIGYPPEDLVLKPAVVERAAAELDRLAQASASDGPAMLVGSAFVRDGALHNGVALVDGGKVQAVRLKHELPNYGTFDELRLFQPGPLPEPVFVRGTMVGVPISEDIWRPEVSRHLADFGAGLLVCINGSPYEINKEALRIAGVAKRRAVDTGLPLAYLNRVGGQDELVFDGASFVINGDGALAVQMRDWEAQEVETRWTRTAQGWRCDRGTIQELATHPEDLWCAAVLALRDFLDRASTSAVMIGWDDGVDAAACAAIAVDALGPEQVTLVLLSGEERTGRACAEALGCRSVEWPLAGVPGQSAHAWPAGVDQACAEETFHARLRSAALLALAHGAGAMLLSHANNTSVSLGGGSVGAYAPLKDVYASAVRSLLQWRNRQSPRIGHGPAGLMIAHDLFDTGAAAPASEVLDAILIGLVEHDKSVDQLAAEGFDRESLRTVEARLHEAEAARRQAPLGVKLTARNFGRDRRYPITHAYRSG